MHGGEVSVFSAGRGQGASFSIRLPAIAAGAPDPAAVQGSEEERQAAFRRIRDELQKRIRTFLSENTFTINKKMKA